VLDADAQRWVDTTLDGLSLRRQVAQLVLQWIPGGYAAPSSPDFGLLEAWVVEEGIGGVVPSIGTPHAFAAKLNALQSRAEIPLLVGSDFENGGPGMRLGGSWALPSMLPQGGGTEFPPTMAFGAIGDPRFAYEYGRITAREARATGVGMLFAPVLDVNSNPDNPVIATRSFGADPQAVAELGAAFVQGARAGGALTTAKHFPGHGDTSVDSHLELPVVDADRGRLDAVELVPFQRAVAEGVDAVMTAHVAVPEVVGSTVPATLAPQLMTGLLRDEMGFDGLLLTDALAMGAITEGYGGGEASVRAVEAGADVILTPADVTASVDAVVAAVASGRLSAERIRSSARRILEAKARLGLHRNRSTLLEAVDQVVGSGAHLAFADTAAARSLTLVRDHGDLVPWTPGRAGRVTHLRYAPSTMLWADQTFGDGLARRLPALETVTLDERTDSAGWVAAAEAVERSGRVVVSAYVSPRAGSGEEALPEPLRALLTEAATTRPTVLVSFGNPYLLSAVPEAGSYLVAWGDRPVSQRAAVRALFGEAAISGRLPIPLPPFHGIGEGLDRAQRAESRVVAEVESPLVAAGIVEAPPPAPVGRNQEVAPPETVEMDPALPARIDSIVQAALADSAGSGAAVAIGRHGRLVVLDGWGELAWGSGRPATPTSIWDLASVSKVVGTTTMAMRLVSEGRMSLDDPAVDYLPWLDDSDPAKAGITIRHLLLHRAGFVPFRRWFFELEGPEAYQEAVAAEPLDRPPGEATVYSDHSVMTLAWVMEAITGRPLDDWLDAEIFGPLGMLETGYNPAPTLRPRIATTEMDTVWRQEMVWGRVHDENADAMGGVAGHAGLFSTAVDLSVFAHALLNGGTAPACTPGEVPGRPCPVARPEPVTLASDSVVARFTTRWDEGSSRALGWDTPSGPRSSAGDYFRASSFGHTGYTGPSFWMDPELDLWVVLLTNRVHPTRENTRHVALRRAVADAAAQAVTDRPVPPREGAPPR